jgi:hypothetical protein
VPNPAEGTATLTSYTLAAPAPLRAANGRRGVAEPLEPRGNSGIRLGQQYSPARLGKNVYCHKEVITTTTIAKPCKTFTSYSIAPRATTTSVSTFLVQVTQTETPRDATTTLTLESLSTVTAPASTSVVTDYAPTITTTSTVVAGQATAVVDKYAVCDPSRIAGWDGLSWPDFASNEVISGPGSQSECCNAVASIPNAIMFWFRGIRCQAIIATEASQCPAQDALLQIPDPDGYHAGFLQCGPSS